MNLAEQWEWRSPGTNPCRHIKRNRDRAQHDYFSDDEASRLADYLQAWIDGAGSDDERVIGALLRLLMLTGCRVRELRLARWGHFKEADAMLLIPQPKNQRPRYVRLNKHAMELLQALRRDDVVGIADAPIFGKVAHPAVPVSENQVRWRWSQKVRRDVDGLESFRIHDLRHYFGRVAAETGHSTPQIADLLGHRSLLMAARYTHLADSVQRAAARAMRRSFSLDVVANHRPVR